MSMPPPPDWALVIPVKPLDRAKSRLAGLAGPRRGELALAMAVDTVSALLACPAVAVAIVVTDDPAAGAELGALGAVVIPDRPAAGLNPALEAGAVVAAERWPGRGRAGLAADLPALRPAEIGAALAAAEQLAGRVRARRGRDGHHAVRGQPGGGVPARVRARLGSPARGPAARPNSACRASAACGRTWTRRRTSAARPHSAWARVRRRSPPACSRGGRRCGARALNVDDGAGQRPGDACYRLDLRNHQLAEIVDVARLRTDDDVVRAGDVIGLRDAVIPAMAPATSAALPTSV